ncbi:unnamed protein product [Moneuplotes crassus]|uniref:Uncharacterized protein n=1 Tax=Euplotes crassus TaxID=5936 RepID=A0AAD1XWY2_EUPCR|nr:unnamed protein product [Moneuplotes crassus]
MEESILASLTKTVPKTKPTNIKIPSEATKGDKVKAFEPSASKKKFSLIKKLTKCSITENEIASVFSEIESVPETDSNENLEACRKYLSDLGIPEEESLRFYYYSLVLKLPVTKTFMVNELVALQVDLSNILQTVYLLLLLKVDEERAVDKYSKFLLIAHDNLLTWVEVLMEASLMNNIIKKGTEQGNNFIITKISDLVTKLAEQQDLILNAKYMLQNMCMNQGISLPKSGDPSKVLISDNSVIIEENQ